MLRLFRLPIRQKLMAMILGTSGVVLLLTCATFVGYEVITFRQATTRQLSTVAEILASNSTGSVAFDNQADATEILSAVSFERHIVAACLYDRQGRLFARFPEDARDNRFPAAPPPDGYHQTNGNLVLVTPVVQTRGARRFGTLYLESDQEAMWERLRLYGGIATLAIVVSSFVAYVLSRALQRQISRPILALAETAQAVADRKDYSVRAPELGEHELGLLTGAMNHMLGQIEQQNRALQKAYDDLRQSQLTIMQQERLSALGQMASGIAHDINNAISPASLYTESLLAREPNLSVRAREQLVTIQRAFDDVANTVARLREFYRPRGPELQQGALDLNQLVRQSVELTRVRWAHLPQRPGASIEIKRELTPGLPPVLGAENEIRDALTNLIFNAVDAMPSGGTIRISTSYVQRPLTDGKSNASGYVRIEVADTGVGMDEETRRRCLEPFFTTKGERGTGLGLAMVYGMAKRHGALIQIESRIGEGTTVRLNFPSAPPAKDVPRLTAPAVPLFSPRRILLVEDDSALLQTLSDILRHEGHEVVQASGGRAGIDLIEENTRAGRDFSVVITDLGMPKVDGRQVAQAVKRCSPQTPVFLLTGWGEAMAAEGNMPPDVDRLLNKPPKLQELREALANL